MLKFQKLSAFSDNIWNREKVRSQSYFLITKTTATWNDELFNSPLTKRRMKIVWNKFKISKEIFSFNLKFSESSAKAQKQTKWKQKKIQSKVD